MPAAIAIFLGAVLGLSAGCTDSERIRDNVYEGLQTRERMVHPSVEQSPAEKPLSYPEYEAERKKLLENSERK